MVASPVVKTESPQWAVYPTAMVPLLSAIINDDTRTHNRESTLTRVVLHVACIPRRPVKVHAT